MQVRINKKLILANSTSPQSFKPSTYKDHKIKIFKVECNVAILSRKPSEEILGIVTP